MIKVLEGKRKGKKKQKEKLKKNKYIKQVKISGSKHL